MFRRFKVSLIIPCYNGERFIAQRLESIMNQKYKPYEIIFLDDASIDNSVDIATKILKQGKIRHTIIVNKVNMGIAHQISKGLETAKGQYIWFAEQDDFCYADFLYTIKKMIRKKNINLAYCNSKAVDENLEDYDDYYNENLIIKSTKDFCVDGTYMVINNLSTENTIPCLSAVVFRKKALNGIEKKLVDYKIFFDWFMYAYALRNGKVSFNSEILNYHMRHSDSVIAKKSGTQEFYEDTITVKKYIKENYNNIL